MGGIYLSSKLFICGLRCSISFVELHIVLSVVSMTGRFDCYLQIIDRRSAYSALCCICDREVRLLVTNNCIKERRHN